MIKSSKPNDEQVDDNENDDEFDGYMEEKIMADAQDLNILDDAKQAAGEEVFTQALNRVKQEVAKVPKDKPQVAEESKEPHRASAAEDDD